jgi:hypothetical protein
VIRRFRDCASADPSVSHKNSGHSTNCIAFQANALRRGIPLACASRNTQPAEKPAALGGRDQPQVPRGDPDDRRLPDRRQRLEP